MIVRHISGPLKRKMFQRAQRENSSIRAVAQRVICAAYGLDYVRDVPQGATPRSRVSFAAGSMVLHLPASVKRRIDEESSRTGRPASDIMREHLSTEFGVAFKPAGRWPARAA